MLAVILLACVLLVGVHSKGDNRDGGGDCADRCDMTDDKSCPLGLKCESNGCGHDCQKVATNNTAYNCADDDDNCGLTCPNGLAKGKNGCRICSCQD